VAVVVCVCVTVRVAGAPATNGAASRPARLGAGDHVCEMVVDGWQRSYYVHVPKSYDAARPTPVVLAFHGAWMNGPMMAVFTGLNSKADAAGFIVAYPNGTGLAQSSLFFNAWAEPKEGGPPDDVKFTAKMIDDLEARLNVDPKRVYATGMSNGGMMCYRLAAELSERVAAIAPVGGTVAMGMKAPKRAVSVIHFHGTEDRLVPFNGKGSVFSRFVKFRFTPIPEVIAMWVKIDGCPAEPKVTELPDKVEDGTRVVEKVYGPGKDGAEVVLVEIEGGGHTWPGKKPPVDFIGKSTMDISANDMIWDFFERHPMK
jgi:polyhydroxybutyrate depolymerase